MKQESDPDQKAVPEQQAVQTDEAAATTITSGVPPPARSGLAGRRRTLTLVVIGAVALGAGSVGVGTFIKSPAQAAAEKSPPPRDSLTATVEHRVLTETLVTRGKVVASQSVAVTPSAPAGNDVVRAVVTKVKARPGRSLAAGTVLLEISGRPVFVLEGAIPAYRDLKTGSRGDDVAQLQRALAALGLACGNDRAGVFGEGTRRAVTAFYTRIGYSPVSADEPGEEKQAGKADASGNPAPPRVQAGPLLPESEVVYLAALPARVDSVTAEVGMEAGKKLMTLSAGPLVVQGSVAANERDLVHRGQKVQIFSETTGRHATGTVLAAARTPSSPSDGDQQQTADRYSVRIRADKPLSSAFSGQDVRLTIDAASSHGKVLVVPSSAISAGADGQTTVTVKTAHGRRRVEVRTGMSGDGYVQVTPTASARLAPGEHVIVGVRPENPVGGAR
ncbi:peptidoglycan-binding protein [Wenjunlia tyrosinilytica]|uniref:Peptidoglycan binding-like domain-containing protein n=1 Tax=Wenjunlia tyrosinilytica TaxID=1544741 RepID=A0A918A019_9ACTN|nr:peptidoglycan-binding protein [Wenjunlia tyrosinilytica]GGP00928.1 hypothetical protein GCM10012280_70750 [Wenjunlia tyrosinilytica]